MSRAVGQHFSTIRKQRQILKDWEQYEQQLEQGFDTFEDNRCFWNFDLIRGENETTHFRDMVDWYHGQLDHAERRLKIASSIGSVVDISDTTVGHDVRCVCDPLRTNALIGNKQRARDNLLMMDFYQRMGRMTDPCHVSKLTVLAIAEPDATWTPVELANYFLAAEFHTVVLGSFENKADAMMYRLAVI